MTPQFTHSESITMHHTSHNGNLVMVYYVHAYVSIIPKVIDNCNVPRCTYIHFFVIFVQSERMYSEFIC